MRMFYTIVMIFTLPFMIFRFLTLEINQSYLIIYGVICAAGLFVFLGSNIYLLRMLYQLQDLLRKYGHVKGYKGEMLFAVLFVCHLIFFHFTHLILEPIIIVLLNTSDEFACQEWLRNLYSWLRIVSGFEWSLTNQIMFIAVMSQMARIQKDYCRKLTFGEEQPALNDQILPFQLNETDEDDATLP